MHHQSNTSNHVSSTNQSLHADVRAVAITTISPSSICPIASQQLATVKRKRGQFKRFSHKVIEWIRKSLALGRNEVLFSSLLSPTNAMCIFVCCVCVPNFSFCNLWLSLFFRNIFFVVSVLFCSLLAFVLWSLQPMYIDDRVDFFFPAEILFWIQTFICSYGAKPYGNRHTENIFIPLIAIRGEWIRTKNSHFRNHTFFLYSIPFIVVLVVWLESCRSQNGRTSKNFPPINGRRWTRRRCVELAKIESNTIWPFDGLATAWNDVR